MWDKWLEAEKRGVARHGLGTFRSVIQALGAGYEFNIEYETVKDVLYGDNHQVITIVFPVGVRMHISTKSGHEGGFLSYIGDNKVLAAYCKQSLEWTDTYELTGGLVKRFGKYTNPRDLSDADLAKLQDNSLDSAEAVEAANEFYRRHRRIVNSEFAKCEITKVYFWKNLLHSKKMYYREGTNESMTFNKYLLPKHIPFKRFQTHTSFVGYMEKGTTVVVYAAQPRTGRITEVTQYNSYQWEQTPEMSFLGKYCVPAQWFYGMFQEHEECEHWVPCVTANDRCPQCSDSVSPTGHIINTYSTRAPAFLKFLKGDKKGGSYEGKNVVYFGAEIELENGGEAEATELYKNLKDYMLCKSDGSIRQGFEIVTTPATYDVHAQKAKVLFDTLGKTKMKALANCGLHFHVSRNAISTMQLGRICEFLYNPENKVFIVNIAGRDSRDYGSLESGPKMVDLAPENYSGNSSQKRYSALNLCNEQTVEFRIFASTITYDQYMYRLDFVKALIDYTRTGAVSFKSLDDVKKQEFFETFLKSNRKEYSFLNKFLGFIKPIPTQYNKEAA